MRWNVIAARPDTPSSVEVDPRACANGRQTAERMPRTCVIFDLDGTLVDSEVEVEATEQSQPEDTT
jgi:hypothetical protein